MEAVSIGLLILSFLAKVTRGPMGTPNAWRWWLFGAAALFALSHFVLLFNAIRCPECGFNPTRFKNGRKKPMNRVYRELAPLVVCPACEAAKLGKEYCNS